jgi:hypothetical protein
MKGRVLFSMAALLLALLLMAPAYAASPTGSIMVTIEPQGAVDDGAQWQVLPSGEVDWLGPFDSGHTENDLKVGACTVQFLPPGLNPQRWNAPPDQNVVIKKDEVALGVGVYVPAGALTVDINPPAAVDDGAAWQVIGHDGPDDWRDSGDVAQNVPAGEQFVNFRDVNGWEAPGILPVTVVFDELTQAEGYYLTKPVLVSPEDGAQDVDLQARLEAMPLGEGFMPEGFVHNASRWQISDDPGFGPANRVLDVASDQLTEFCVPRLLLDGETPYWWRVQYLDLAAPEPVAITETAWADPFAFTTTAMAGGVIPPEQMPSPEQAADILALGNAQGVTIVAVQVTTDNRLWVGIAQSDDYTITRLESIDPADVDDGGFVIEFPFGLIGFKLTNVIPGDMVTVTVWFSEALDPESVYFKFNPVTGWQDYSAFARFAPDGRSVELDITDGGVGDADGLANGIIVDPGAPGVATGPAPAPPLAPVYGSSSNLCFIESVRCLR